MTTDRMSKPAWRAAVLLALFTLALFPLAADDTELGDAELTRDGETPRGDEVAAPMAPETIEEVQTAAEADPIVITATRVESDPFLVPYATESIDGDTIVSEKAFRSLPEALRETPGVLPQKTAYGQGSPFIRGFTGFRTLLLIDGIRVNSPVYREGPNQYWSTIDPFAIGRLEIVRGPSSVLYGSDAIGGTVNVISRESDLSAGAAENELRMSRRLYYRYASAEESHTTRAETHLSYGPDVNVSAGVSYADFGELSGGRHIGTMPNTGYDQLSGDLRASIWLRDDLELVLAVQGTGLDRVPRTHSTIHSKSYRGSSVGTDLRRDLWQDRYLAYTQLHWHPETIDWLTRLSISVSYQHQEEIEERIRSSLRERRQGFQDGTLGVSIQADSPTPIGTFTYGIEHYHDHVDSFFREFNADGTLRRRSRGPVADDATYDMLGIYVQDSIKAHERVEVILGGRLTYVNAQADDVDPDPTAPPMFGDLDEDFLGVVGSARVMYQALDEWNIFGGVSQGFRAPNLSDLTRFDVARSGEVETPAPDLDPERYVSFEIGSKLDVEQIGLTGYLAYHYTIIDGMIIRFPTGNVIDGDPEVTKDNVGDGFVHGVDLGLAWEFCDGFTAFGTFAWIEGQADTFIGSEKSERPLSRLQPATALLGLRWDSPEKVFWVEGTATIVREQRRLSPRDAADTQRIPPGGTPGYTAYTLRAGAEVFDGFRVFSAIENITDRDYRVHGSGQNEPGTNVVLGVDWTF